MEAAVHAVVVSVGAELLRSGAGGPLWSELESGGLRRSGVSRVGREGGRNLLIVAVWSLVWCVGSRLAMHVHPPVDLIFLKISDFMYCTILRQ